MFFMAAICIVCDTIQALTSMLMELGDKIESLNSTIHYFQDLNDLKIELNKSGDIGFSTRDHSFGTDLIQL